MVGTLLRGVHVIIHLLLVLTADQVVKFSTALDAHGPHNAFNLNSMLPSSISRLCEKLDDLRSKTTRIIYLLILLAPKIRHPP